MQIIKTKPIKLRLSIVSQLQDKAVKRFPRSLKFTMGSTFKKVTLSDEIGLASGHTPFVLQKVFFVIYASVGGCLQEFLYRISWESQEEVRRIQELRAGNPYLRKQISIRTKNINLASMSVLVCNDPIKSDCVRRIHRMLASTGWEQVRSNAVSGKLEVFQIRDELNEKLFCSSPYKHRKKRIQDNSSLGIITPGFSPPDT